jgi:hypothetical protein
MAHDKTPERNNLIFFYTVLSVVTLIALGFVFTSYFNIETERVVTINVRERPAADRERLHREQRDELQKGPVPIDRAMDMLARQGRAPLVQPVPSRDMAALEGWNAAHVRARVPAALLPGDAPADDEADAEGPEGEAEGEADEGDEVAPEGAAGDTSPSPEAADAPTDEASQE